MAAAHAGRTVAVGSHGGVLGHLISRIEARLPERFWLRIRNPHLFVLEAGEGLKWVSERTFDGTPGVRGARAEN